MSDIENTDTWKLGQQDRLIDIDNQDQANEIIGALLHQASIDLKLVAPTLQLPVFHSQETSEALARAVTRNRRMEIRILVCDQSQFIVGNTRLVELCRRLSSFIKARRLTEEFSDFNEIIVIADDTGFYHQGHQDLPKAAANLADPGRSRQLARHFTELWGHSTPVEGLLTLGL